MEATDEGSLFSGLKSQFEKDPTSTELKWFWFRAALFSYKRDFLLRPFPPAFRKKSAGPVDDDENKDFDRLITAATKIPPLSNIFQSDNRNQLSTDQIRLLAWVFDTERNFNLSTIRKETYEQIKTLTGQKYTTKVMEPAFVFRVDYDEESERKFEERKGNRKTVFAYHGSRLQNFYSIARNGLRANLNKVSAFGEGTYLSPELSVSLNWSPLSGLNVAPTQSDSIFDGARLSCVAVCEIIDDPTHGGVTRCECTLDTNSSSIQGDTKSSGDVPDRYILVKNDDLVRIRYVLTYVEKKRTNRIEKREMNFGDHFSAFCGRHRFWLIMMGYFVLLGAVGLVNSRNFQWYFRRFWSSAVTGDYSQINGEYHAENFLHGYDES